MISEYGSQSIKSSYRNQKSAGIVRFQRIVYIGFSCSPHHKIEPFRRAAIHIGILSYEKTLSLADYAAHASSAIFYLD